MFNSKVEDLIMLILLTIFYFICIGWTIHLYTTSGLDSACVFLFFLSCGWLAGHLTAMWQSWWKYRKD